LFFHYRTISRASRGPLFGQAAFDQEKHRTVQGISADYLMDFGGDSSLTSTGLFHLAGTNVGNLPPLLMIHRLSIDSRREYHFLYKTGTASSFF